jgi:hypothetical protein
MMTAKGLGSTVVLNVLLWLSLVISIPLAGFHPIYATVAITGAVIIGAVAALAFGFLRGARRASRILHAVGDRIPGLSGEPHYQSRSRFPLTLSLSFRYSSPHFHTLTHFHSPITICAFETIIFSIS